MTSVHSTAPHNLSNDALVDALDTLQVDPDGKGAIPEGPAGTGNIFPDFPETKLPLSGSNVPGAFEVSVSDPEKKGDGISAFTSYKVNTKVQTSPGQYTQSSVVRRYSDFAWLRERLLKREDGWLIPPLPEKAFVGRFSPIFVDSRRRGLERFLDRLSKHSALCNDPDVHLFLHGSDQEFNDVREVAKQPKEKAKSFLDYVSQATQAAVQTMSSTFSGSTEHPETDDDITCKGIGKYADSLESTVDAVYKHVYQLTRQTKTISNTWFEFGFNCTLLAQYETEQDEQQLGNAFKQLGACADRLSVLFGNQVDAQVINFQEPFEDFIRVISSIKEALKARESTLHAYHGALSNLESRQARLQKLQAKPDRADRLQQIEQEVQEAQTLVDTNSQRLNVVTNRVFSEVARFRKQKRYDFKILILEFIRMQIETARKIQAAWENILPEIEALPFTNPSQ